MPPPSLCPMLLRWVISKDSPCSLPPRPPQPFCDEQLSNFYGNSARPSSSAYKCAVLRADLSACPAVYLRSAPTGPRPAGP
jgi:hypothetical protein